MGCFNGLQPYLQFDFFNQSQMKRDFKESKNFNPFSFVKCAQLTSFEAIASKMGYWTQCPTNQSSNFKVQSL